MSRRFLKTAAVIVVVLLALGKTGGRQRAPDHDAVSPVNPGDSIADMAFVYDSAARFNESVVNNVDAIDGSLTAILAGAVAIAVFTIEKIATAVTPAERCALGFLAASIVCCSVGYLVGFAGKLSNRDGLRPRTLIGDLTSRRPESILGAIQDLIDALEVNLSIRMCKRILATFAVAFLVVAVVFVAVVRSEGGMVNS